MKLALQLAYRNLIGAGLRTWLNVGVLSFSFIIIIFYNGWIDGWNQQARTDTIEWSYASGHVRIDSYDPLDPFTLTDAHGKLDNTVNLTPVLLRQASIYPNGRMMSALLKGIDANQDVVALPTHLLNESDAKLPVIIGTGMANSAKLALGDEVLLRWRDVNETFDATSVTIAGIFKTNVPSLDGGQLWMKIEDLQAMAGMPGEATYFIANEAYEHIPQEGWHLMTTESLLADINTIIQTKKASGSIMYLLLLAIALLAIFDTQVLSVFRRQKEIGTYISLGMTRKQVVGIFTIEGTLNSVLATIVGAIYGIPLLGYVAKVGIAMPYDTQTVGVPMAERMYPTYGLGLILFTVILVVLSAIIVSYLPSKRIAKMDPVLALKGKIQ